MIFQKLNIFACICCVVFFAAYVGILKASSENGLKYKTKSSSMNIGIVVCGPDDRVEETIVNIKSALLFSKNPLKFHIFTEENLKSKISNSLSQWPSHIQSRFEYEIHMIEYPKDGNEERWKKLFKLCATQRLFLPHLLEDVELLLYVDTDILFLSPVDDIWSFFKSFNDTHISAMAPEHEEVSTSWYPRFARHPYYGNFGINSGVMLMDMSRIRKVRLLNDLQEQAMTWKDHLLPLYQKYKFNISWGDQDLLNIIFSHNPDKLLSYPCCWNYRPDHCIYSQVCQSAKTHGAKVLHGSRRAFHIGKWPEFKAVYSAIKDYKFDQHMSTILQAIDANLQNITKPSNCKKVFDVVLQSLRRNILSKQEL